MADDSTQPVRCLVVPSDAGFLLIPSASVAEIVPLAFDQQEAEGTLLGYMAWRGVKVPVYSMEGMAGMDMPEFAKRSKAVIFYPWKGMDKNAFFALATQHDPRPRLISDNDFQETDAAKIESDFVSASFQYDGESALIPDLKAIAQQQ